MVTTLHDTETSEIASGWTIHFLLRSDEAGTVMQKHDGAERYDLMVRKSIWQGLSVQVLLGLYAASLPLHIDYSGLGSEHQQSNKVGQGIFLWPTLTQKGGGNLE